ncbi:MAG: hypothetical protein O2973_13745 [Gemmatimonadetes bacterium]|nr:hypothetical protein [Gemmatimonadota bacterium]
MALAPDGQHLIATGNADAIEFATPKLKQMKPQIVEHLRNLTRTSRSV